MPRTHGPGAKALPLHKLRSSALICPAPVCIHRVPVRSLRCGSHRTELSTFLFAEIVAVAIDPLPACKHSAVLRPLRGVQKEPLLPRLDPACLHPSAGGIQIIPPAPIPQPSFGGISVWHRKAPCAVLSEPARLRISRNRGTDRTAHQRQCKCSYSLSQSPFHPFPCGMFP